MEAQNLGMLDIKWRNNFGNPGHWTGPEIMKVFKKPAIEIQPVHPVQLVMERSSPVTFRIYNNGSH